MNSLFGWSGRCACILASGCLWGAEAQVVEPSERVLAWRGVATRNDDVAQPQVHWLPVDPALPLQEGPHRHLHPLGSSLAFVLTRRDGKSEIVICDPSEIAAVAPEVQARVRPRHVATWLLWNEPLEQAR